MIGLSQSITQDNQNPFLAAEAFCFTFALAYAARGWRVLPLHNVKGGRCTCRKPNCESPGKHPRLERWPEEATTDPRKIKEWWCKWPDANVGILTGKKSGIVVLDVDPRNGGDKTLREMEARHGRVPRETVTVKTGGGGWHVYLRYPDGFKIPTCILGPGLELKAELWQVVVPPSRTEGRYEFTLSPDDMPLAPMPAWLIELAVAKSNGKARPNSNGASLEASNIMLGTSKNGTSKNGGVPPVFSPLSDDTPIPKGTRHSALCSIAGKLRYQGKDEGAIKDILHTVNCERCQPPLSAGEVERIAAWITKRPKGDGRDLETFAQARALVNDLLGVAFSLSWPGLSGATEREVLLAFLSIAYLAGTSKLTVSTRQAADLAGVEHQTAIKAIRNLCTQSWLRRLTRGRGTTASLYQLQRSRSTCDSFTPISPYRGGGALLVQTCRMSSDTWRWGGGLGKTARLVWECLGQRVWKSAAEIAAAIGVSKRTVERCLAKLARHGLAAKEKDGWKRGPEEVENVAKRLKSAGKGERQGEQHRREREAYLKAYEAKKRPRNGRSEGSLREQVKVPAEAPVRVDVDVVVEVFGNGAQVYEERIRPAA